METSTESLNPTPVSEVVDSYALSSLQSGMLFNHLYLHSPGVDLIQAVIRLPEAVQADLLERAWQSAVERHAVLRTSFEWENLAEPVQHVHASATIRISCEDLRGLSPSEQPRALDQYQIEDKQRGFDLTQAPLLRLKLFRLADSLYTLIWTYHHIIIDGRSLILILEEAFARYDALVAGNQFPVVPTRQYREFVACAKQPDLAAAEQFWQAKLKDFTAPTALPKDKQKTREDDLYPHREIWLSEQLSTRLNEVASAQGVTLNTVIQAAWVLLLSRYSGESDVVFGASKTVRHAVPDGKSIIGLMLSTLPVRIRVDENASVAAWLQALRGEWVSYRNVEHTPLTLIQRVSELPAGTSPFETLLMFEHDHYMNIFKRLPGCSHRDLIIRYSNPGYSLTLLAFGGKSINLALCYDAGEFHEATAERMLGHLHNLLEQMAEDPQRRVADLALLTSAERKQVLSGWNDTARDYPELCVHEIFEQQAARTPQAVAVIAGTEQLTYAELNGRANRLARYLQAQRVKPGALVGICLRRSADMLVAVLATLKAGAAYVPLDPEYPRERLKFMLQDAGAKVLLTERALADELELDHPKTVCVEELWPSLIDVPAENLEVGATIDDLVYVIYTSGSTGKPKGVCLPHCALSNLIYWQLENSTTPEGVRTLQFTSLSFDVSFQEIFATWCSGGTLVLISESLRRDSTELLRFMRQANVQRIFLPFVALQSLAEAAEDEAELPGLREVITAGEQLQITPQIARLFERLPACALHNHYGPSETHVVTAFTLRGAPNTWASLPPIGHPIANTQIYLLDSQLRPVPVGVNGELYIGGTALATGYLNRAELTNSRFVSNPFSAGTRLYRTGDLARYLPNGDIEYSGRIDNQVKIRGHRIELGEIEAVLRQHPNVRDAAVTVVGKQAGKHLAAYIVGLNGVDQASLFGDLRTYLKQKLPDYMVPTAFAYLEKLPVTPSGKINRRALPEITESAGADKQTPPRTPTERMIAAIWAEVLGVEQIGIRDNFFDMGHSLQATQVMSRLRRKLNVDVPLRVLFENPVLEDLARTLEQERKVHGPGAMEIVPVSRDQQLPLSFAQQRMWFIHQMDPHNPVYNLPIAVRLSGKLDREVLQRTLNEIVRRHEILRTTFGVVNDAPVQNIAPELNVKIKLLDLENVGASHRDSEAKRLFYEEALQPFDLANGPLLRATLLRSSDEEHLLVITLHHIVGDGWSAGVLFNELAAVYPAFLAGKPSPLPPLAVQYADYAAAQRQWLQGEVLERQLAFWRKQLQGAPTVLELPTDRPRPDQQSFRGAWHAVVLPSDLVKQVKALGQKQGVTLFMTLMAAFQVLLGRYAQGEDFLVGTDLANRTSIETEALIGFFINVLPIRANLTGNPKFSDLLVRVRETAMSAFAHQEMPLDKLVEELQPERALSHNPMIQVLFVLQNAPKRPEKIGGVDVQPFEFDVTLSKFDLAVFFEERGEEVSAGWLYVSDLFDAPTIARMAAHYEMLLRSIVAAPEARIANLEMLTPEEREQQTAEQRKRLDTKSKQLKMARRKMVDFSPEAKGEAIGQ